MPSFVEIGIPLLAVFVALYKFKAVWRDGQWNTTSVVFDFWMFSICVAVSMSFLIEEVYLRFDLWVGMPNLGWLIAYVAMAFAFYFIACGCYVVYNQLRPSIMPLTLAITLFMLILLYGVGIATIPEKPDHLIPKTFVEMLFMQTMYLYIAGFCLIPGSTFLTLYRNERVIPARLRLGIALLTTSMGSVASTLKIVVTFWVYLSPTTPVLPVAASIIGSVIGLGGLLWPLVFLPNGAYVFLSRPFVFLNKLKALRELRALQSHLNTFCSSVITDRSNWIEYLRNPDFHLYRAVIGILDAKNTLAILVEKGTRPKEFPMTSPNILFRLNQKSIEGWGTNTWEKVRLLHQALQTVDDHLEFPVLIESYQDVGQKVNRQLDQQELFL